MEVAKTFERDGKRYRPGDALPEGLDGVTLAHYKRHGMVRESRTKLPGPDGGKPAGPGSPQRMPAPRRNSTPKPGNTSALQGADPTQTASNAPPGATVPTDATPPVEPPDATGNGSAGAGDAGADASTDAKAGEAVLGDVAPSQEPAKD